MTRGSTSGGQARWRRKQEEGLINAAVMEGWSSWKLGRGSGSSWGEMRAGDTGRKSPTAFSS